MNDCKHVLNKIWTGSLSSACWTAYFARSEFSRGEGILHLLKHEFWELRPGYIDPAINWYQCDTCGNLFQYNLRGVCLTYQCEGTLHRCEPQQVFQDNHYRTLYTNLHPARMICEEHTAQLTGEAAAELQERFIRGQVNVLSCSTTFELGVDVGDLQTVLMRNVPPSPANYVQRAGRAGRRTESTAFAVTFCQRRSHDLTHFQEPERMVSGHIQAPYFELRNEKIIRRHVHAVTLAHFWKNQSTYFGNGKVNDFFFESSAPEALDAFLETRPQTLRETLLRIVPEEFHDMIGVPSWQWKEFLSGEDGSLTKAALEIRTDVETLERVRQELSQQGKKSDHILYTINTLQRKDLIGYLSTRNVLPKYGFPVDVVELQIRYHGYEASRLELNRDLRIAISEYAPESEVVAGGHLWVSYGLKKIPERKWLEYDYAVCPACGHYHRSLHETKSPFQTCRVCNSPLRGRWTKGVFVIPEFGFVTNNNAPKQPRERRPQRTFASRAYFSDDERGQAETRCTLVALNGVTMTAVPYSEGRLTVLNRTGFKICATCGFAIRADSKTPSSHQTPWGTECRGRLSGSTALGHEFKTDVVDIRFDTMPQTNESFRFSLLYAMLEGMSESLEISRNDIDGCLFTDTRGQAFILYDTVPGGAGHVKRVAQQPETLRAMLQAALEKVKGQCGCGEETSCYGCLRNYRNQFCHEQLIRGHVKDFLQRMLTLN